MRRLKLTGVDAMEGPLALAGNAVNPLEAVPLQQLQLYVPLTSVATQVDMEAETAAKAVTADVQHFGPSAVKAWAAVQVTGGVPAIVASYNITSITDSGPGLLTITIGTDFSSVNYVSHWTVLNSLAGVVSSYELLRTAGSSEGVSIRAGAADDPDYWSWCGLGDQ